MACKACEEAEGGTCMTCDLKAKGFVQQSDMEKAFREHGNTNEGNARNNAGADRYGIADFIGHYNGSCNNPDCAIHTLKVKTENDAFVKGVNKGISFGAGAAKKGLI